MSNQKYYVDLSLTLVFETCKDKKDDLIAKINECIQMMIEKENSISVSSTINVISEEQVYSVYASTLTEKDYN